MIKVNIADVKAHLSRYLAAVEAGDTIVICRRNMPIAEIRPLARLPEAQRPVGIDRGMTVPASFFEPLPDDLLDAFESAEGRA
jgi:prevent-host-death family protein